ncbi:ATP-binding cassette domain-containing protein [bacterium]|nr:ATP-binding cassette domain-containing protein [bacterium]
MTTTSNSVLHIENLQKNFGPMRAVDGVSLDVRRGEIFGFLGPNGAGKTTTIGILLGLIHPSAGTVEIFGEAVTPQQTAALRRVGSLVGASPALVPYLSARQNLQLVARLHRTVDAARIEEVLHLVKLTEAADRRAARFSTGMKQRLGLGMALLHRPELLILDEPTNGMDPAGMREIRNFFRSLADDGVTVFVSSHLLHEVEQMCDRVAVLHKGKIVAQGAVDELRGGQSVVRVRIPDPAAALRVLPSEVDVHSNGSYIDVTGMRCDEVIVQLVNGGVVPTEVTTRNADLEALFLRITGEDEG